jgi:hypothetical protein
VGIFDVVNANTDTARWRLSFIEQARDHQRVFFLGANRGAILAIASQIESTLPFTLQIDGFAHHLFIAGNVLARRDHGNFMARSPQGISRMDVIASV